MWKKAFCVSMLVVLMLLTGCGVLFGSPETPDQSVLVTLYPRSTESSSPYLDGYFPTGTSAVSVFEPPVWPDYDKYVSALPKPDFGMLIVAESDVSETVLWQIVIVDASVPDFLGYCEKCLQCGIGGAFDELTGGFTAATPECVYRISFDEINRRMSIVIRKGS